MLKEWKQPEASVLRVVVVEKDIECMRDTNKLSEPVLS